MSRPTGRINNVSKELRAAAKQSGMLPHEWLLMIVQGKPVDQKLFSNSTQEYTDTVFYPDFKTRLEAAKVVAPFFAPKLATMTMKGKGDPELLTEMLKAVSEHLPE